MQLHSTESYIESPKNSQHWSRYNFAVVGQQAFTWTSLDKKFYGTK